MTQPSVGRVVHYTSYGTPCGEYGQECRAAMITEVLSDVSVGLCVLNPTGMFFRQDVQYDAGVDDAATPAGGMWHWPERV